MTREELLAALEITPESMPAGSLDDAPTATPAPAGPPPSPTALALDDWSRRRGAEAIAESDVLGPILRGQGQETAELAAADFLAAAFEPSPRLAERCTDATRHRFLSQLMESEEYQALHADTQLDQFASELAAGHFAQSWVALAEREREEDDRERDPGKEGEGDGDRPKGQGDESFDDPRRKAKRDIEALKAAAEALDEAKKDVDDLRDAQRSLGGDGAIPGQTNNLAETKARFERIKRSGTLRRIMQLAGRYRRLAQAKQRQKTLHGRDDVVGVELGNDLGRLVPAELAALGDEDLELDALRRYLERGLMQRDYRGVESKGEGPIVVVVDESGSMSDEPIETAKAFALAMGWIARHQNRWLCLVGFSGGCPCNCLTLPPGKWDQVALLDWLEHFYSGGSYRDVPLEELPKVWPSLKCPEGKTDVIQITDALCRVDSDLQRRFNAWKEATQAKYYTIVLGSKEAGDLRHVSDRVWCLPDLDIERDAIGELMSI